MRVTRADGKSFVTATARESIVSVLPRREKVEALKTYREAHGADFVCAQNESGQISLIFGNDPGYALAESARQLLGSKTRILWIEKAPDSKDYIFVVLDHGAILEETILGEHEELDSMLLMEVFDGRHVPVIHNHGELPPQLQDYLIENQGDAEYIEYETPLIDQLKLNKAYQLRPYEQVFDELTASKSLGLKTKIAITGAFGAIFFIGYLFLSGDEQVARVFDKYASYRSMHETATASEVLTEIYTVLLASRDSRAWVFTRCDYEKGPLVCELSPRAGARTLDLNELQEVLGRPVTTKLVENKAHAIITLQPQTAKKDYMIVDRESAMNALRDRLLFTAIPKTINVMAHVNNDSWSQQNIAITKDETGFHFIAQVARSTAGLPTKVAMLTLERKGVSHTLESTITVYGAN